MNGRQKLGNRRRSRGLRTGQVLCNVKPPSPRAHVPNLVQAVGLDLPPRLLAGRAARAAHRHLLRAGVRRRGPPLAFGVGHAVRHLSVRRAGLHAAVLGGLQDERPAPRRPRTRGLNSSSPAGHIRRMIRRVLLLGHGAQGRAALHDLVSGDGRCTSPSPTPIRRSPAASRGYPSARVTPVTLDAADHAAVEASDARRRRRDRRRSPARSRSPWGSWPSAPARVS